MFADEGSARCGTVLPTAYRSDVVFWIVPVGEDVRHGTTTRPGALPAGSDVLVLCARGFKLPVSTPWPDVPKTKSITRQCEDCAAEYERLGRPSTVWDF